MKNYLNIVLCFMALLFQAESFAQNCFFAKQMGGYEGDNGSGQDAVEEGNSIALDNSGNVYTAGRFSDTADFDPGPGIFTLIAPGINGYGSYVSKLDNSGNFVWAVMPAGDAMITDMAIDAAGNVYVTGNILGLVDFDPGPGTMMIGSASNIPTGFIWKLNSAGSVVWVKSFEQMTPTSLALNSSNEICFAGYFNGTVDFDPGSGTHNLTTVGANELFLAKISSAGTFSWAFSLGESFLFTTYDLAIDNNNNIIYAGDLMGTLDFDPGSGSHTLTGNGFGSFISKYTSSGSLVWAYTYDNISITSVAVDGSGNVYYDGTFPGTVDIDPGATVYNLTASIYFDVFVAKLSDTGSFLWAHKEGGVSSEYAGPIAVDNAGNVYITGYYDPNYGSTPFDLDPGSGVFTLPIVNISFLVKFNSTGNFVFAKSLSRSLSAFDRMTPKDMCLDLTNNIYTTGFFKGTLDPQDYDPDPNDAFPLNTPGGSNENQIFVCKFPSLTAAASYTNITCFGDNNGTAIASVLDGNGPFMYSINSLPAVSSGTFTGLGPGSYIIRVSDVNGCTQTAPSFYINEPAPLVVSVTSTQESCVGGGANGTATAAVTGGTLAYSYSWNTSPVQTSSQATALSAGQYIVTVTDANACTETGHVVISEENNPSDFNYSVNGMVVSFAITGTGCNTFLWDFGNGNTSSLNTAPIVTYATAGTYNACLQCNGQPLSCVTCKSITVPGNGVGISAYEKLHGIKIYPNPGNGKLTIEHNTSVIPNIKVFNLLGGMLLQINNFDKEELDLTPLQKGIYILEVEIDSLKYKQRIIIQ